MTTTVITSKGQIVIPAKIRKQLNIKKGTRLRIAEEEGKIIIQPVNADYFERLAGFAGTGKDLVGELLRFRAEERRREDMKWK